MKRLRKESNVNPHIFRGVIDKLGQQGRVILKDIESYKFQLEQSARITANDPVLTQNIIKKKKELDKAAAQIYAIVFDIENIDVTKAYQEQPDGSEKNEE